jgi:nicotinate-nucleotide adenylyltransferase
MKARGLSGGRLHLEPGMRVGLFGGSFNPVHAGHVHAAAIARRRLGLQRVIWLVTPGNPLKAGPAALSDRLTAASRVAGRGTIVSDIEAQLGLRYSIDTVRLIKRRFPKVHFVFVIGSDNFASLHAWRDWRRLMRQIPLAVIARPGASLSALRSPAARRFAFARLPESAGPRLARRRPPAWIYLGGRWNYASSTALRELADQAAHSC